jgi:hypothetical protein
MEMDLAFTFAISVPIAIARPAKSLDTEIDLPGAASRK